eukprot:10350409-Alexandrium_andersonii.AAC.1
MGRYQKSSKVLDALSRLPARTKALAASAADALPRVLQSPSFAASLLGGTSGTSWESRGAAGLTRKSGV